MALKRGYIYVIVDKERRWAKVGMSRNPRTRLMGMLDDYPFDLQILAWAHVKDANACDIRVHQELEDLHIKGEWFRYDEERIKALFPLLQKMGLKEDQTLPDRKRRSAIA